MAAGTRGRDLRVPRQLLWAFLPPSARTVAEASRSPEALDVRDVPDMLKDFGQKVGSLEIKCLMARTKMTEGTLTHDPDVQLQARICASINARLHEFFYNPSGRVVAPSSESEPHQDAFRINKLKQDFETISPKFHGLCASYPLVPEVPVCLVGGTGGPSFPSSSMTNSLNKSTGSGSAETAAATSAGMGMNHERVRHGGMINVDERGNLEEVVKGVDGSSSSSIASGTSTTTWSIGRLISAFENGKTTESGSSSSWSSSMGGGVGGPHMFREFGDVDKALRQEQLEAVQQIRGDVESLRRIQEGMISEVAVAKEGLDEVEDTIQNTQQESRATNKELAKAAKMTSQWWAPGGAGAGALAGTAAGAFLGPPGMIAGAAIGGALGLVTGGALTQRHRSHMESAVRDSDPLPPPPPRDRRLFDGEQRRATESRASGLATARRQSSGQRREMLLGSRLSTKASSGSGGTYRSGGKFMSSSTSSSSGGGASWLAAMWGKESGGVRTPSASRGGTTTASPSTTATTRSGSGEGRQMMPTWGSGSSSSSSSSSSGSLIRTNGLLES